MARIFIAMNGKRINTLDDLKDNFNSSQMISFYRGGRLQKWLQEIGASEELENVQSFEEGYDDDTLLSMLMAVFELSDEQIAKATPAQPEPVAEEVPVENVVAADEKTTDVQGKQSPAITAGCSWQICQLGAKDDNGEIQATCQDISDAELATSKLISGPKQHYNLSRAFFFDGYFWTKILTEKEGDVILAKSQDGIHWEIDVELKKFFDNSFSCYEQKYTKVKVCDRHFFIYSAGGQLIFYSQQDGWNKKKLEIAKLISSLDSYEFTHLEEVFEQGDCFGIIGIGLFQAGLFSKTCYCKNELHICYNLLHSKTSDFIEIEYPREYCDNSPQACTFNGYLMVATAEHLHYAELDQKHPKLKRIELPEKIEINLWDKFFAFKNTMFIINTASTYNQRNASGKLIYTTSGLDWKECEIDSNKIIAVGFTGRKYVALAEEDYGKSTLYSSETGEIWSKVQTFTFSRGENVDVLTAGNDKILIYNGSTSGKYILVNTSML